MAAQRKEDFADEVGAAGVDMFAAKDKAALKPSYGDIYESKLIRIDLLKDQIRRYVTRGIHNATLIIQKVYNPDQDDELSKEDIVQAYNDVMRELVNDIKGRDIRAYYLSRMLEFDEQLMVLSTIIDSPHTRAADKISAINTANKLSDDRLKYLNQMGIKVTLYDIQQQHPNQSPTTQSLLSGQAIEVDQRTVKELDRLKQWAKEADEIEVEFKEKK